MFDYAPAVQMGMWIVWGVLAFAVLAFAFAKRFIPTKKETEPELQEEQPLAIEESDDDEIVAVIAAVTALLSTEEYKNNAGTPRFVVRRIRKL